MSLEFDDLSIVRENPTEEMQSNYHLSICIKFSFLEDYFSDSYITIIPMTFTAKLCL